MRFLADMGVSWRVVGWLRDNSHDATHLREQQLHRLPNGSIFAKAAAERRIILTWDLDFTEIVALSGTHVVSAVVFRLLNTRSENVIRRLAPSTAPGEAGSPRASRKSYYALDRAGISILFSVGQYHSWLGTDWAGIKRRGNCADISRLSWHAGNWGGAMASVSSCPAH